MAFNFGKRAGKAGNEVAVPAAEEKIKSGKIISIAGEHVEALVYMTARLLGHGRDAVLIVDNTPDHVIFKAVGHEMGRPAAYERNITVVKDVAYEDGLLNSFSYVVVYHGLYPDEEWWEHSDIMFVFSDFNRFAMKTLGARLHGLNLSNVGLVLTGRYLDKVHDTVIPRLLGLPGDVLEIAEEIPADERAEALELMFQYDGTLKPSSIPQDMKKVLYSVYKLIAEPEKGEKMNTVFSDAE